MNCVEGEPSYIFVEEAAAEQGQLWRDGDGCTPYCDETGAYAHDLWRNDWPEEMRTPAGRIKRA